jgi:hypothetical protein
MSRGRRQALGQAGCGTRTAIRMSVAGRRWPGMLYATAGAEPSPGFAMRSMGTAPRLS